MKEIDVISQALGMGFAVSVLTIGDIRVEKRGDGKWAVLEGGSCLNREGRWEYEPLSSSRTDEFLDRCRFTLEEAIAAAAAEATRERHA